MKGLEGGRRQMQAAMAVAEGGWLMELSSYVNALLSEPARAASSSDQPSAAPRIAASRSGQSAPPWEFFDMAQHDRTS